MFRNTDSISRSVLSLSTILGLGQSAEERPPCTGMSWLDRLGKPATFCRDWPVEMWIEALPTYPTYPPLVSRGLGKSDPSDIRDAQAYLGVVSEMSQRLPSCVQKVIVELLKSMQLIPER